MPLPLSPIQQPPYMGLVDNTTVYALGPESVGPEIIGITNSAASRVWTANLVIYVPVILSTPFLVAQFFWINGATVNGDTDVGVYSEDGQTKLGSTGATLNAGASLIQVVNVTDFRLPANRRLWLALGSDSGTQTYTANTVAVAGMDYVGIKQQAAGYSGGLPATAAFAIPTVAVTPLFGITGQAVI